MIKTSGHRVSPEEVEREVEKINNIDHAVVFSIENDILGEEIILACVKKNHLNKPSVSDIKIFLLCLRAQFCKLDIGAFNLIFFIFVWKPNCSEYFFVFSDSMKELGLIE